MVHIRKSPMVAMPTGDARKQAPGDKTNEKF